MDEELIEAYKLKNKQSIDKRAKNRQHSMDLLKQHEIEFKVFNNGVHLVVTTKFGLVDFWPGTGKFKFRKLTQTGRGVFKLLRLIK